MGATVAAVVGYALYSLDDGWKWMLASPIPVCIFLLIGRSGVPESPLWLVQKGRTEEAHAVMERVYGMDVEMSSPTPARRRCSCRRCSAAATSSASCSWAILTLCQVAPMYAIYTFGPEIMTAFGLGAGHEAILGESVVSLFFLIGSIPAMFWLNSMGRRPLLIRSLALMAVGLVILGLFPDAPVFVVVIAYAFFSGGPGILQWLYPNELFPTEVRASAVGIAIAFSRIGTVVTADPCSFGVRRGAHHARGGRTGGAGPGAVGVHGARDAWQVPRRDELAVGVPAADGAVEVPLLVRFAV
ncbi:MAG: MFS transporter [Gordonibacter pamelaeae]